MISSFHLIGRRQLCLAHRTFTKDSVRGLLTNPLYVGKVRCHGEVYEGAQDGIVADEAWREVQARLTDNAASPSSSRRRTSSEALLAGIARCGVCGSALSPSSTRKGARTYSYYVCQRIQKEGAKACPGSRVRASNLEAFVVERIRQIGRDPGVLEVTLEADRSERESRLPELKSEGQKLASEKSRVSSEQRNLVEAVARGGAGTSALLRRLETANERLGQIEARAEAVRAERQALELGAIDPADLQQALADLEPIWSELFPRERARVLALLIAEVRFDAVLGEVAITFRPGGPKALWRANDGGQA